MVQQSFDWHLNIHKALPYYQNAFVIHITVDVENGSKKGNPPPKEKNAAGLS